jgi:hypothetical protein
MNELSGYYYPSGKIEAGGLSKLFTYGFGGTLLSSIIAGYAASYLGTAVLAFFTVVLGVFLGLFTGYFVSRGAEAGKIRNRPILISSGFFFGLLAVYLWAVFYILSVSGHKVLAIIPGTLAMQLKNTAGWFSTDPTVIYWLWIVAAAAVFLIPGWRAFRFLRKRPFCENCNLWLDKKESLYPFPSIDGDNRDMLAAALKEGEFGILEMFKLDPTIMNNINKYFTQIDVEYCSSCRQFYLLSVTNYEILQKQDHRGREYEEENRYPLVVQLIIPPKVYKTVRSIDYVEKPMDVDAMINEVSWTHKFKGKFLRMFID